MYLYIAMTVFYILLIMFNKIITKYIDRKLWSFLLFLPLLVMTGLKHFTVGSDTSSYKGLYQIFSTDSLITGYDYTMEFGYRAINKVFGLIGFDFLGFQIIYAIFIYYILIKFTAKNSKNIAFSVFFYVVFRLFFFSMTGIRQMISIAIILNATKFIENRRPIKYLLSVIIASTIHASAILSIFLYFIPFKKLDRINLLKLTILTVVAGFGVTYFLKLFIKFIPKYAHYMNRIGSFDGSFTILQTVVIFSFMLLNIFIEKTKGPNIKLLNGKEESISKISINDIGLNALIFTFIICVFSININVALRLSRYFTIYLTVYLPNKIEEVSDPRVRIMLYYLVVSFLLIYFIVIMVMRPGWEGEIPYRFFWQ